MIDMHMHTTHSDGTDSVEKLLYHCQKSNLDIISITDHNTCKSYDDLKKMKVENMYKGKIIVGCEFTTSYKGKLIEVLGYGFDYRKIEEFLYNYYTKDKIEESTRKLYKRLLSKIKKAGFIFEENNLQKQNFDNEFFERSIYAELI